MWRWETWTVSQSPEWSTMDFVGTLQCTDLRMEWRYLRVSVYSRMPRIKDSEEEMTRLMGKTLRVQSSAYQKLEHQTTQSQGQMKGGSVMSLKRIKIDIFVDSTSNILPVAYCRIPGSFRAVIHPARNSQSHPLPEQGVQGGEQGHEIALAQVMQTLNPGDPNLSQIRTYKSPWGRQAIDASFSPSLACDYVAGATASILQLWDKKTKTGRQGWENELWREAGIWDIIEPPDHPGLWAIRGSKALFD